MGIVGKKVLVLGLSRSGIAAANFAKKHGANVYLTESRDVTEDKLSQIKELQSNGIHTEYGGHSEEFIMPNLQLQVLEFLHIVKLFKN